MKMQKIKRILVPIDFSENGMLALGHAAFMARLFKADLYLLHVIEVMEFAFNVYDPILLNNQSTDEMEKFATENLNKLAKKTSEEKEIQVIPLINKGRVISGITEAAKDNKIDIIVMGTHGAKGFDEYFVGSNADKTVTVSPCPVLTMQANAIKLGFKNIVLPIDNSLHSRQKVDLAIELASVYKAKINILGLINSNEDIDENKFNIKLDSVEKAVKKANVVYVREIVKGKNSAVEAMNFSEKINADLIMIMTDQESNLSGMFLGGFAKQIVNHSKIPVLSVRPEQGYIESLDLTGVSNPFNNPD
jgi:nucleotide-binding universal stress UspA family protein